MEVQINLFDLYFLVHLYSSKFRKDHENTCRSTERVTFSLWNRRRWYFILIFIYTGNEDKHIDYFRGKALIKWFQSPENIKYLPFNNITADKAEFIAAELISNKFIHVIESIPDGRRRFIYSDYQEFSENSEFACDYKIPEYCSLYMILALAIVVLLLFTMPWWPYHIKIIVYYFTIFYIVTFTSLLIIRYALYVFCWVMGYSVWIFPRLNDDLGIVESFTPIITIEVYIFR